MTKTTATKTVKISTKNVGQNFGTVGVLKARNGRVVAETDTYPRGFAQAATDAAEALAAKLGYEVVS